MTASDPLLNVVPIEGSGLSIGTGLLDVLYYRCTVDPFDRRDRVLYRGIII